MIQCYICFYLTSITVYFSKPLPTVDLQTLDRVRKWERQQLVKLWVHCGGGNGRPHAAPWWAGGKEGWGPTGMHGWPVKLPSCQTDLCLLMISFFHIAVSCCFCVHNVLHLIVEWALSDRGKEKKGRFKKVWKIYIMEVTGKSKSLFLFLISSVTAAYFIFPMLHVYVLNFKASFSLLLFTMASRGYI